MVQFVSAVELADEGSGRWVVHVGSGPGKLLHKFRGYFPSV